MIRLLEPSTTGTELNVKFHCKVQDLIFINDALKSKLDTVPAFDPESKTLTEYYDFFGSIIHLLA